jgi:hypothetical protein
MTAGMELKDCAVIVVRSPHGPHEGDLMHHVAHVREPIRHVYAILAALCESCLHRIQGQLDVVLPGYEGLHVFFRERIVQRVFVRRL